METIDPTTGQVVPQATPVAPVTPPTPTVVQPVQPPTAQTVYSAHNITQAALNPVKAVNPALEEYNAYLKTPEMLAAKARTAELQQAINAEKQGLRSTTTGLEYQNDQALGSTGASMNLIGRQVGRASELSSDRQAALGEQLQAATAYQQGLEQTAREKYNIVQAEKSKINALIVQTGNQAGISPTDTFEVATEKAFKWEQKQKEEAKKTAQKDDLKAKLQALGLKTSGSMKDLEKRLNKAIKEDKASKKKIADIELALKNKELAKPYYAPDKKTASDVDQQYSSALPLLVDKNTGYADANKVLQLDQEYFQETGKNFSKNTLDRILAPDDPMRARFGLKKQKK